ncbi:MAG: hypothetical protein ACREVV_17960 [Steroidobacteraceae bacterium]
MQDLQSSQRGAARGRSPVADTWAQPSSSRMLATYLADVEQLLDEQHWDMALRDAFDLPQIAVALTDPQMCSSHERCKAWCAEWIRPSVAEGDSGHHDRICRALCAPADEESHPPSQSVPSAALRRLRLRRHARIPPRGFSTDRQETDDPCAADAVEICTAVVDGVRRWYAHSACHDAIAQANLARLAVLR